MNSTKLPLKYGISSAADPLREVELIKGSRGERTVREVVLNKLFIDALKAIKDRRFYHYMFLSELAFTNTDLYEEDTSNFPRYGINSLSIPESDMEQAWSLVASVEKDPTLKNKFVDYYKRKLFFVYLEDRLTSRLMKKIGINVIINAYNNKIKYSHNTKFNFNKFVEKIQNAFPNQKEFEFDQYSEQITLIPGKN